MSILTRRPALRWLVPAGVIVAVVGGGAAVRAISAAADPTLPPRTAAQLLVDLQSSKLDGFHGTVTESADLGLPALPNIGGSNPQAKLFSLASGAHTMRVWYSGPDKARVALLDTLGETDLIRSGRDVWFWDSRQNAATHQTLPEDMRDAAKDAAGQPTPPALASPMPTNPQEAAAYALKAIDPSTVVSTAGSAKIAGRSAYELVLTPRDSASLVGQVRVALDATEHAPLRVQVYPKGATKPAFESAFTQVSFKRPNDSQFRFNPPPGAKVDDAGPADAAAQERSTTTAQNLQHAVIGTGWTTVAVMRVPDDVLAEIKAAPGDKASSRDARSRPDPDRTAGAADAVKSLMDGLPSVSGAWGSGKLFSTKLFSALLTDDGRLLFGAVASDRLVAAAADPAAALKGGK